MTSKIFKSKLRALAPYLTLDKFFLARAYYPQDPLWREVDNSKGKIWSDRTWVELGEAPLNLKTGGTRYYHLWGSRNSLSPWGWVYLSLDRECPRIWAHFVGYTSYDKTEDSGDLWVVTSKGLEVSSRKEGKWGPLELVAPGEYIFMESYWDGCLTLSREGFLERHNRLSSGAFNLRICKSHVRSIRPIKAPPLGYYGTTFDGTPFVLDVFLNIIPLALQGTRETFDLFPNSRYYEFERFRIDPSSEGEEWALGVHKVGSRSLPEGSVKNRLYRLPDEDLLGNFWEIHGILPKELFTIQDDLYVLSIEGKVYKGFHSINQEAKRDLLQRYYPYRMATYEKGSKGMWGITWGSFS